MTIYNPILKPAKIDRIADYFRDAFGVSAPEAVTVMAAALVVGTGFGIVAICL